MKQMTKEKPSNSVFDMLVSGPGVPACLFKGGVIAEGLAPQPAPLLTR